MSSPALIVDPGQYRTKIEIQSPSAALDEFGQPQETWSTILTTWARVRAITLREQFAADQLTSQVTHEVTMRWPSSVTIAPGMQVVVGSKAYKIQACDNVLQRNTTLRLQCLAINETS